MIMKLARPPLSRCLFRAGSRWDVTLPAAAGGQRAGLLGPPRRPRRCRSLTRTRAAAGPRSLRGLRARLGVTVWAGSRRCIGRRPADASANTGAVELLGWQKTPTLGDLGRAGEEALRLRLRLGPAHAAGDSGPDADSRDGGRLAAAAVKVPCDLYSCGHG